MKRHFEITKALDNELVVEKGTGNRWHKESFRVLYADTDRAGPVYHANYLRYFEVGRSGLIRSSHHSYKAIEALGVFHPIVDLRVQFESSAEYDDLVSVYARPLSIEPVKFSYAYVVRYDAEERLLVHGYTTHCCIDRAHRVLPVDEVTVSMFKEYGITPGKRRSSR